MLHLSQQFVSYGISIVILLELIGSRHEGMFFKVLMTLMLFDVPNLFGSESSMEIETLS